MSLGDVGSFGMGDVRVERAMSGVLCLVSDQIKWLLIYLKQLYQGS